MAEKTGRAGGTLQGGLQNTVNGALSHGQNWLNAILPPEKREDLWARINRFANDRPKLAAFLLSHLAISGLPLGLFLLMTVSVTIFALLTALLVGLLGALLFIVFAVGVALCLLLPTLFFTTLVATCLFLWGLGGYFLLTLFNEKRIPGVHTGFVEGIRGEFKGGDKNENNYGAQRTNVTKHLEQGDAKNEEVKPKNLQAGNGQPKKAEKKHDYNNESISVHADETRTTVTNGTGKFLSEPKVREVSSLDSEWTY